MKATNYALANTYAIKWNNSEKKDEQEKGDILLNSYGREQNELFLFKDGSMLFKENNKYTPTLPNIAMDISIEKESVDNHFLHIVFSRTGCNEFRDNNLLQRHLFIYSNGEGSTNTGDDFMDIKEELNELEMKKMTNNLGIDLIKIKNSLEFINKQGSELKDILTSKSKPKTKKGKDKKNHP